MPFEGFAQQVLVHVVFFWRDPGGGGIDDVRAEKEFDLPGVPRIGEEFDVETVAGLRVRDVRWSASRPVSVSLEELDASVFGDSASSIRKLLEAAGWELYPIGRAQLGMWPETPSSS